MSLTWVKPLVVVGLLAGAGWHFREPLQARLDALMHRVPAASTASVPASGDKETVYRWVDDNGVTHFDQRQQPGSQAVEIDQRRIRSMDSLNAEQTGDSGSPVVSLPPSDVADGAAEQH